MKQIEQDGGAISAVRKTVLSRSRKQSRSKGQSFEQHFCARAHTPNLPFLSGAKRTNATMIRRSFSRAAVALNGTTINPNVKAAKVQCRCQGVVWTIFCFKTLPSSHTTHVSVAVERQRGRRCAVTRRRGTTRASSILPLLCMCIFDRL